MRLRSVKEMRSFVGSENVSRARSNAATTAAVGARSCAPAPLAGNRETAKAAAAVRGTR